MKIAVLSGKGGTGKSTLVASLSLLVNDKMLTGKEHAEILGAGIL